MSQVILSFSLFPVLVILDTRLSNGENEESCRLMALFGHLVLLSNTFWMMNLSCQFFLRLNYYVYRRSSARLFYSITGWILPCFTILSLSDRSYKHQGHDSCLSVYSSYVFIVTDAAAVLVASVTLLLNCFNTKLLTTLVRVFRGPEEKILREKMESTVLLHSIFIITRLTNVARGTTDYHLLTVYLLACCIFMESSIILLGFVLTNEELLVVLRVRYFEDDEESRKALEDFEIEDSERLQIQKEKMDNLKKGGTHEPEKRSPTPKRTAELLRVNLSFASEKCTTLDSGTQ
ncbi:uncharacterized protein [Ptychodera flava]|uniref:uncharacterized protein isoform X2 n=1 Tax=Ptychodera flava TaxID=63121 RepID=UPI00396A080C